MVPLAAGSASGASGALIRILCIEQANFSSSFCLNFTFTLRHLIRFVLNITGLLRNNIYKLSLRV
ncbi:MAG: hypothetical protein R2824_30105 [Saprospiraceae bacterium]|nr:hypothetical protein [Lewinella sp.]